MHRGMQYRPEYRLDRLRMMLDDSSSSDGQQEGERLLHLRWLKTMVVDLSHTAERDAGERLALQRRSAVDCAVERVVCKDLSKEHLAQLLPLYVRLLTSLDLRGCKQCSVDDAFLLAVAGSHRLSLRRLYLPWESRVAQSTLDRFTQLEELDASGCENLTNVDFCSATIRVLCASMCRNLTDAGLRRATRLEVLHVGNCERVTDPSPFARCLLELAAWNFYPHCSGIGSDALSDCRRLQVLHVNGNTKITTLCPFAQRLRELDVGCLALSDAALADATGLVSLSACGNGTITTVAPFGASLRRLEANESGMIRDAGLMTATNLVYLDASYNVNIRSVAAFSASLLELKASDDSGIDDAALSAASNLIWLDVSDSERITTVQFCGRSLRHLVAWGDGCALTNEGVRTTTRLVTLKCSRNPNLTTMEPFLHCLEELATDSEAICLEVRRAACLHSVLGSVSDQSIAELERNEFIGRPVGDDTFTTMHRNTVTYVL